MEALFALIVLFLIGNAVSRFFTALIKSSPAKSGQNQRYNQQRSDLNHKDAISLKDAFLTNNATRQSFAGKSSTASSQKRNQQARSNQLSSRMQQEAARKRAEHLQQNNKRRPEVDRPSTVKTTLFKESTSKQTANHTLFERTELTSLTPIDKVHSAQKTTQRPVAKKTHFQSEYVNGIIFKEILDKPVSLRHNK